MPTTYPVKTVESPEYKEYKEKDDARSELSDLKAWIRTKQFDEWSRSINDVITEKMRQAKRKAKKKAKKLRRNAIALARTRNESEEEKIIASAIAQAAQERASARAKGGAMFVDRILSRAKELDKESVKTESERALASMVAGITRHMLIVTRDADEKSADKKSTEAAVRALEGASGVSELVALLARPIDANADGGCVYGAVYDFTERVRAHVFATMCELMGIAALALMKVEGKLKKHGHSDGLQEKISRIKDSIEQIARNAACAFTLAVHALVERLPWWVATTTTTTTTTETPTTTPTPTPTLMRLADELVAGNPLLAVKPTGDEATKAVTLIYTPLDPTGATLANPVFVMYGGRVFLGNLMAHSSPPSGIRTLKDMLDVLRAAEMLGKSVSVKNFPLPATAGD